MKRRVLKKQYARAVRTGMRKVHRIHDRHNRSALMKELVFMVRTNSFYGKMPTVSNEAYRLFSLQSDICHLTSAIRGLNSSSGRSPMSEALSFISGRQPKADAR